MNLYSDFAPRRSRQILGDGAALLLIGAWVWLGVTVFQLVSSLSAFGVRMEDAGAGFKETMVEVGSTLGAIPLIGSGIRVPFDGASDAGSALQDAGQSQQMAVSQLATGLGAGIAALPIVMILVLWLVPRIRFARNSARARTIMDASAGIDLLALRALANQKISALSSISPNAVDAWRRGDETVMLALARLELKSAGVRLEG
jgi:Na+(H+)/acetate symporter ActP